MALPKTIKDDAYYRIELTRVVPRPGNIYLRPGDQVIVTGAVLKEIRDAIGNAVEVTDGDAA